MDTESTRLPGRAPAALRVERDDGERLVLSIGGEIDHHACRELREAIDARLAARHPARLVLDLDGVTFMDSAGLGLMMGRLKRLEGWGGSLILLDPPPGVLRILNLAGASRLVTVERSESSEKGGETA